MLSPLKASPDCWNAWSHGSGSHGWSGGPWPPVSLMINTHIHNYCSPQRGKVRGRVAWESMMCLFTFSAGWVDVRSWGFLRTDQMFGVWWLTKVLLYQSVWMCVHFRKCLYWLLFLVNTVKKEKSKMNECFQTGFLKHATCLLLVGLTGSLAPNSHHWLNQCYCIKRVIYEKWHRQWWKHYNWILNKNQLMQNVHYRTVWFFFNVAYFKAAFIWSNI